MEWPLTCNQLRLVLDDLELFDPKMGPVCVVSREDTISYDVTDNHLFSGTSGNMA